MECEYASLSFRLVYHQVVCEGVLVGTKIPSAEGGRRASPKALDTTRLILHHCGR